jgi:hypothetical protein
MDATGRGRTYTDNDMAGSLALQQYGTNYTIATGVITLTITGRGGQDTAVLSNIVVDTEAAAASDDLDTINGGRDGMYLELRAANSARTIVIKNGTGNIACGADFSLDNTADKWCARYDESLTKWCELSRADNGA